MKLLCAEGTWPALIATQRLAGTLIGAGVTALFLTTVSNKTALEWVIVVLFVLAGSIRTVNYAWYTAAVAGAVLIAAAPSPVAVPRARLADHPAGLAPVLGQLDAYRETGRARSLRRKDER